MDIESLRIFLDVWKVGSISGAAKNHYMTQPAVGKRLALLEKELGIELFQRGKGQNQVKITPSGKAFVDIAERMLMLYEQALDLGRKESHEYLSVACIRSAQDEFLPQILAQLKQQYPSLCVTIEDHHTVEIFSLLENRRVDIGVTQSAAVSNDLTSMLMYEEDYRVVMGDYGLFSPDVPVHPSQLPSEHGIFQEFDRNFQVWFDQWWPPYSVKMRVNTTPTAEHYFTHPKDWMIVPAVVAKSLEQKGFVSYPLNPTPPKHQVFLCFHKKVASPFATCFYELAMQFGNAAL